MDLHVQPGAKKTAVAGVHGDALRIRVAAPPAGGRANAELIDFLAGALGVPRRSLQLVKGAASRRKSVRLDHATTDPSRLLPSHS